MCKLWLSEEFIQNFRNNPKRFKTSAVDNEKKYSSLIIPRGILYRANRNAKFSFDGLAKSVKLTNPKKNYKD